MKSHRKAQTLHVPGRAGLVYIAEEVAAVVRERGIKEGPCPVNSGHIIFSVFINNEDPGLKQDYLRWLERLALFDAGSHPAQGSYLHHCTGEDIGGAHHKRQSIGREVGRHHGQQARGRDLGAEYGEFDGRRGSRVLIKLIGA